MELGTGAVQLCAPLRVTAHCVCPSFDSVEKAYRVDLRTHSAIARSLTGDSESAKDPLCFGILSLVTFSGGTADHATLQRCCLGLVVPGGDSNMAQ